MTAKNIYMFKPSILTFFITLFCAYPILAQDKMYPVFDAHIHYSEDVWDKIKPQAAIAKLKQAGIMRALVSSSSDEGTQMLYQADPDFIIPVLRPYRKRGTLESWMHDETVIPYLKSRLAKHKYVAIGELHLQNDEQVLLPVIQDLLRLAKQHKLILHVHANADIIEEIYANYPEAEILWAHAGFEYGYVVRELLERYPSLNADLSFRYEIFVNGRFLQDWNNLLVKYADRFMFGIDTYIPERWVDMDETVNWQQQLLQQLPAQAAENIAYKNGERLFTKRFHQ